ncbi:hypothetical protein UFOVP93_31 [uncultured Caudovirales phage]|uniref:Uncharacterized protein n=1 Tax=uncultured Caudovirales phage TaxID=2100421 RepID=A0A6J5L397_9CAUD|nr:hypothetical protein UFOVP93_31 [uncultured Caudovirales phage]
MEIDNAKRKISFTFDEYEKKLVTHRKEIQQHNRTLFISMQMMMGYLEQACQENEIEGRKLLLELGNKLYSKYHDLN